MSETNPSNRDFQVTCPTTGGGAGEVIELAHGGGGRRMHELIRSVFAEAFDNPLLNREHDGAVFEAPADRLAFTTDSYVVQPIEFPGGDIGSLAVHGTVNDLLMCGARPLHLSVGFILEAGLPIETLRRIVGSMRSCADAAGVRIVTGDTKVVQAGKADGLYINTAGVGAVMPGAGTIGPDPVRPGDAVVLSGDIARHGIAVMAEREGLAFESAIRSDTAPLNNVVLPLLEADPALNIHCLRDLTRGGLASALIEVAEAAGVDIRLEEPAIPVDDPLRGACEILGLDPLYVANEGRCIAILPEDQAERAVGLMRRNPVGANAAVIGRVVEGRGQLTARTGLGTERLVPMISGEQLPRIC